MIKRVVSQETNKKTCTNVRKAPEFFLVIRVVSLFHYMFFGCGNIFGFFIARQSKATAHEFAKWRKAVQKRVAAWLANGIDQIECVDGSTKAHSVDIADN
jgi:hypothetical protein